MVFDAVKEYIANSGIVPKAVFKADTSVQYDAIFYLGKPEQIEAEQYLVYSFKQNGGSVVKRYTLEILVCAKEAVVSEELKEKVVDLLNFYCRPVKIRRFTKFVLSEAEGINYDPDTGVYFNRLVFDCYYL